MENETDKRYSQKMPQVNLKPIIDVPVILSLPTDKLISQGFGNKFIWNGVDFYGQWGLKGHNGQDFTCQENTPIYSPCPLFIYGYIQDKFGGNILYCITSEWDDKYRLKFRFMHLNGYNDIKRQIPRGVMIASSGNTGEGTTGPHLHYDVCIEEKIGNSWQIMDYDNGYHGRFNPLTITQQMFKLKKVGTHNDVYAIDELKRVKHKVCNEATLKEGQRTGLFEDKIESISTLDVYINGSEIMLTKLDK